MVTGTTDIFLFGFKNKMCQCLSAFVQYKAAVGQGFPPKQIHTSYAMVLSGIPWNMPHVTCTSDKWHFHSIP